MKTLLLRLILVTVLFGYAKEVHSQVRVRKGIHLPKLRNKEKTHHQQVYGTAEKSAVQEIKVVFPPVTTPGELDEHFHVRWDKNKGLRYEDFKNNRNLYNKFIPEQDTDIANTIYPDYIAFYNMLKKRAEETGMTDDAQDERIERLLKLKTDSLEKGYISSVSVDIDLSFTITIDSPAASVINLNPVIYPLTDTSWYFSITPVFNKYDSWMIVKSQDILQHEQIHFDIFELFARKMRKHLVETLKKSTPESTANDLASGITLAYEQLYQQMNQMQLDFDKETGEMTLANAPLTKINAAWVKSIKAQLNALNKYEAAEGTIIVK